MDVTHLNRGCHERRGATVVIISLVCKQIFNVVGGDGIQQSVLIADIARRPLFHIIHFWVGNVSMACEKVNITDGELSSILSPLSQ
jgi:hypothetical protein